MKRFRDMGYIVYEDGRIWSELRSLFLKFSIKKNGYAQYILMDSGKRISMTGHRVVAETFLQNPNNYNQVNHIDGNKLNNNVSNLEWCTQTENTNHAYKTGLAKGKKGKIGSNGEKNGNVKLTEQNVKDIRLMFETGLYTRKDLFIMFGISKSCIEFIIARRTWKHI